MIVDPTIEEEDASDVRVTIAISEGSPEPSISAMQKGNSQELKIEELYDILDLAEKVWKKVFPKIEKSFKEK